MARRGNDVLDIAMGGVVIGEEGELVVEVCSIVNIWIDIELTQGRRSERKNGKSQRRMHSQMRETTVSCTKAGKFLSTQERKENRYLVLKNE
jgi:hypothetical protein